MKRFAILLALCSLVGIAHAVNIEATSVPPTLNVDDSPIPASGPGALASTRFEVGSCAAGEFGTVIQAKIVAMPDTVAIFAGLPVQVLCVRAFWKNNLNEESTSSAVVVLGAAPSAGSIIVVKVSP